MTLGQLLYSLPLAPGESTKIAVIDWTRRTSATTEEDIAQTEQLSNTLVQSRAISEIAEAVAEEAQEGSSDVKSKSSSEMSGFGGGGMLGVAMLGGAIGTSKNKTKAHTFTTSKGKRELSTGMQQNISSSTQQNAFSARNKRAAIISEATQQEREQISTRTVTNYNHMHALSIQYYEVVQLYQTIVRLEKCERCLFIPMKAITFNEQAITRFRSILFDAALNSRIQELLVYATGSVTTNLELRAARRFRSDQDGETKETANQATRRNARAQSKFRQNFQKLQLAGLIVANNDLNTQKSWEMIGTASFVGAYWSGNRVSRMTVKKEDDTQASLAQRTSAPTPPGVHQGLGVAQPISELSTIELEFSSAPADALQDMTLVFRLKSNPGQNLELKCDCILPAHQTTAVLLSIVAPMVTSELIDHLNENALYYSQQVWLRSDPSLLALQLAPFTFKNKRVIEYVDPAPVNAAANYLVFRWKDEADQAWKDWVKENADKTKVEVDTVALPTGGVFAEAVLGRFNSAEKLEITRFWNWQDSPIPIQAPDIAAIQAGQHTVTDQPAPGSLESPIVNIQTPPALPDPTGMQAILQTLAASNLFRDMSGITQAAALAQSSLQNASQGAVAGMNQAGANMATFANFQIEMAKVLASLAPMLLGLPPVPPPASKNISNAGAAINQGAKMDARQNGVGQAPNPPPIDLGGGGTGGSGGGGSSPGPTTVPDSSGTIFASTSGSRAGAAFDALIGRTTTGVSPAVFGGGPGQATSGPGTGVPVILERETGYIIHDFDVGQASLKPEHKAKLDELLAFLDEHPDAQIVTITGRASQTGPERNNEQLSFNRAETTRVYLLASGILPSRIGPTIGRGSRLPIVDAAGSEEPMNRSVEIICDWKLELKQVPSISSSRMSTRWNIDFGATFGVGAAIVAGQVQIGRLTKRTSGESRPVQAFLLGPELGKSLGPVVAASVTVPGFEEGDFETPGPVDFDYFDGQPIALFPVGGALVVGGSATKVVFPRGGPHGGIDDPSTRFANIDIGFTIGLGGAALFGILNVNDE